MNINTSCLSKGLEYAEFTAKRAEPLEKFAKMIYRYIDLAGLFFGKVSAPFETFASQLKEACTAYEMVKVFGNIKMFIVREKNGEFLLTNSENSWQKKADRVTLLCHNTFKFVKGLSKFGFVKLGIMAKEVIGKLPIFNLAMDGFIIASSAFSTWDSVAFGLPKAFGKTADANESLDKWRKRLASIEWLKVGEPKECANVAQHYLTKFDTLNAKIESLTLQAATAEEKVAQVKTGLEAYQITKALVSAENNLKKIQTELKQAEKARSAVEPRIELIKNQDWRGLAESLEANAKRQMVIVNAGWKEKPEDLKMSNVDFKIRKYEAAKENAKIETNKTWLKIANAIGKIAVVALAMVLTATNLWIFPTLVAIAVVGNTVDTIGWAKFVADEYYKNVTEPIAVAI